MSNDHLSESHKFSSREVEIKGRKFLHLHCTRCERDFVKQADATEWRAAHLGIFRFNLLVDTINRRWVVDECPGHPLLGESNDMRRNLTPLIFVTDQKPARETTRQRSGD